MKKIAYDGSGGRVLGLYPVPGLNALWNNPVPWSGKGWRNPGGDRVWLSPESELFFPNPKAGWEKYTVPTAVDPGKWTFQEYADESAVFRNAGEAVFCSAEETFSFELRQKIIPLDAPGMGIPEGVAFVGYSKQVFLQTEGVFRHGKYPAIWNLLQVPPGGKICAPAPDGEPCSYFGTPQWIYENDCLVLPVSARGDSFKCGIPIEKTTGRMCYIRTSGKDSCLVLRNFTPAKTCCDAPFGGGTACPQQLFSDNGNGGGFGEMEHHSEPVSANGGITSDLCFTGAFYGRTEACIELLNHFIQKGWKN